MTAKNTLKQCLVFSTLGSAELEKIAGFTVERQYEAGATIFKEQARAEELLVIEEGRVALQIEMPATPPPTPRKVTVDVINKNEMLGWSAFIEPGAYILTAVCLQNIRALAINSAKLRSLMREDTHLGYEILSGLIRVINSRLQETIRVLVSERAFTTEVKG
ncbi:MAG: cyclic nucleotide-binding domain-containing protein [Chloroflexota bacterium]